MKAQTGDIHQSTLWWGKWGLTKEATSLRKSSFWEGLKECSLYGLLITPLFMALYFIIKYHPENAINPKINLRLFHKCYPQFPSSPHFF